MKRKIKEETLRGYVVASEWDQLDNVVEVSIQTEDDDYVIDRSNALGREMFDLLDQDIEVTGIVRQNRRGTKVITVTDFEQLEEEDEYRFDDDWGMDFGGEGGETPY